MACARFFLCSVLLTLLSLTSAARTLRRGHRTAKRRQPEESGDGFEYGDKETQVSQSDSSDFSVHQFLVNDDARQTARDSDNSNVEMAKQKAMAADDHFNSEDTPDPESFAQKAATKKGTSKRRGGHDDDDDFEYGGKEEAEVTQSSASDFSAHQFMVKDDARDGPDAGSDDPKKELAREAAASKDDHFNSEDTPDPDSFAEVATSKRRTSRSRSDDDDDDYEYGSKESEVTQSDAGDFSVHQFLVSDDARDGPSPSGDDPKVELARQRADAQDDHFNSEDTPDPDAFAQVAHSKRRASKKSLRRGPSDDDDYEYGGKEQEVTQSNAGDFSTHQFLVNDDARDGPAAGSDDPKLELAKQRAAAQDDHFNSEDTPDPDAFAQVGASKRSSSRRKSDDDDDDDE